MKILKYIKIFVLTVLFAHFSYADDYINIPVGEVREIEHPLEVNSYKISSKDIADVESVVDKKKIRIVAKAEGTTSLQVISGNATKIYTITVASKLRKLLTRLRSDLDSIATLDLSINQDYIVIKGTVSDAKQWAHLEQVLSLYKENCHNFATFSPNVETVISLKKMLEEAGYTFKTKDADGMLSIQISPDALVLAGVVYSDNDLAKINSILSTQKWLSTTATASSGGTIKCINNIVVKEMMLQVDVVYVGLTKTELNSIGAMAVSSGLQAGAGTIASALEAIGGGATSAAINLSIDPFSAFLAENGLKRVYTAGHVSFLSNDQKGGKLHTGGTLHVKVSGIESGSLQEINYGLQVDIKGGLVGDNKVKLDMKLSLSDVTSNEDDTYTQSTDEVENTIVGELDKTIIMAGTQKITETTSNSGTAILRNIPVVSWFTSEDTSDDKDVQLLVLICPRILEYDPTTEIYKPLQSTTAPVYQKSMKSNAEIEKEEKEAKKDKSFWDNFSL